MTETAITWVAERDDFRAGVEACDDGSFRVHLERLVPAGVPEESPFWDRATPRVIVTDTLDRARVLALEELNIAAPLVT